MTKELGKCDRCKNQTNVTKMSFFDRDMICLGCQDEESNHKDYEKAREVELAECKKGNNNFDGIGLPKDLKEKYK